MTEREAQIRFERQLISIIPQYSLLRKVNSDTIFFYINKAKGDYIKQLYRAFQLNQEISDKLRTLVKTKLYVTKDFESRGERLYADYPEDYMFALGENVYITISNNQCPDIAVKSTDVIEATIENVDRILNNSLSEHHLRYNQAKPVRLYTENKIVLITDGNYTVDQYNLTYLRNAKDLGKDLRSEYTDLPDYVLTEIVDVAVDNYVRQVTATSSIGNNKSKEQED